MLVQIKIVDRDHFIIYLEATFLGSPTTIHLAYDDPIAALFDSETPRRPSLYRKIDQVIMILGTVMWAVGHMVGIL